MAPEFPCPACKDFEVPGCDLCDENCKVTGDVVFAFEVGKQMGHLEERAGVLRYLEQEGRRWPAEESCLGPLRAVYKGIERGQHEQDAKEKHEGDQT